MEFIGNKQGVEIIRNWLKKYSESQKEFHKLLLFKSNEIIKKGYQFKVKTSKILINKVVQEIYARRDWTELRSVDKMNIIKKIVVKDPHYRGPDRPEVLEAGIKFIDALFEKVPTEQLSKSPAEQLSKSLFLAGPSGVGKNYLIKLLSKEFYPTLIEFNINDFPVKKEAVNSIIQKINSNDPNTLIVFDDIESLSDDASFKEIAQAVNPLKAKKGIKNSDRELLENHWPPPVVFISDNSSKNTVEEDTEVTYSKKFNDITSHSICVNLKYPSTQEIVDFIIPKFGLINSQAEITSFVERSGNNVKSVLTTLEYLRSAGELSLKLLTYKDIIEDNFLETVLNKFMNPVKSLNLDSILQYTEMEPYILPDLVYTHYLEKDPEDFAEIAESISLGETVKNFELEYRYIYQVASPVVSLKSVSKSTKFEYNFPKNFCIKKLPFISDPFKFRTAEEIQLFCKIVFNKKEFLSTLKHYQFGETQKEILENATKLLKLSSLDTKKVLATLKKELKN